MKTIRPITVTNTLTGKKEELKTLEPGKLSMYSCGPTVYGLIHIGNLRAALAADLFYRYFKRVGYDVTYVRNYTDIDDKIIKRANEEGIPMPELTAKYISEVERDYAVAGMAEPTHKTKATDFIPGMIQMIEKIIKVGKAYVADDGEVLFAIDKFEGYGKLSGKKIEDLDAGQRVEVSNKKRNPLDFTLWKPAKPGEPCWPSPWGEGRPGWHIECSVMSSEILGPQIDVHHGGLDLTFPHHENEIAQSEAASGKDPFVGYWLHSAFLTLNQEKMSKSLGNVFQAREFLTQFTGEVARYMLLSMHYRSQIDFGPESIEQALHSLERIYEAKKQAIELSGKASLMPDQVAESAWGEFVAKADQAKQDIDDAYANDFNTPAVLGHLFSLIREFNRVCQMPNGQRSPTMVLGAQALIKLIEDDIGDVLGVGRLLPEKALKDLEEVRIKRSNLDQSDRVSPEEVENLIRQRKEARGSKDFARADQVRDELAAKGVILKDSADGTTTWSYK